jgi:hypothetical protein
METGHRPEHALVLSEERIHSRKYALVDEIMRRPPGASKQVGTIRGQGVSFAIMGVLGMLPISNKSPESPDYGGF